ncbi:MAG: hypothetical protein QM758_12575 [Armatimonas sp.]
MGTRASATLLTLLSALAAGTAQADPVWSSYAGNAQHTANSSVASQSLQEIAWSTPVDLHPQYTGTSLLIHYGSPTVTEANTILIPVKTGESGGFRVEARSGLDGSSMWSYDSDFILPSASWTPSYAPAITAGGRIYMPGAGGSLFYRDNIDSSTFVAPTRVTFYGDANYNANTSAYNSSIKVCTPLTTDSDGNVYFGYRTEASNPLGITSGIARIGADGSMNYIQATTATGGAANRIVMNCAPAVSNDGKTVYVAMSDTNSRGYMVALNSSTLATTAQLALKDPKTGQDAILPEVGSASPTVAPDGKVFFGVLESPFASSKGWMLQMDGGLKGSTGAPGAFGWDDTATIIPASAVSSYHGSSAYLLMTKYNNYAGLGGDGINKLAIVDPNDTQVDPRTGQTVMKEVITIAGITPDEEYVDSHPGAVREWCINTAVYDPATHSVLANSEDGRLYRWDLNTNTFTESITLTQGIGEAYTPTFIGADGKVYAINNATLFAVGNITVSAPEPGALCLFALGGTGLLAIIRRRRHAA